MIWVSLESPWPKLVKKRVKSFKSWLLKKIFFDAAKLFKTKLVLIEGGPAIFDLIGEIQQYLFFHEWSKHVSILQLKLISGWWKSFQFSNNSIQTEPLFIGQTSVGYWRHHIAASLERVTSMTSNAISL